MMQQYPEQKQQGYFNICCYLPRLPRYTVLEETICQDVVSDEYFGIAETYSNDCYADLKRNQSIFSFNSNDQLAKLFAATAQIENEKATSTQI